MGKYANIIKRVPIYIEMGQSNKDDKGYYPQNVNGQNGVVPAEYEIFGTNDDMKIFWRTAWNTTKNGDWENVELFANTSNATQVNLGKELFGATMVFSKKMADYKGSMVATIKATEGSTALYIDWQPAGGTWLKAKAHIEDGLSKSFRLGVPDPKAVSWFQGYSDCFNDDRSGDYLANLNGLIGRTNAVISSYFPDWSETWLIQESPNWVDLYATIPEVNQDEVRASQAIVGGYAGNLFLPNTNCVIWSGDNTHLTAASYEQIGIDCFNILKDL